MSVSDRWICVYFLGVRFTLLMVVSSTHNFKILIEFQLTSFSFVVCAFGDISKKLVCKDYKDLLL